MKKTVIVLMVSVIAAGCHLKDKQNDAANGQEKIVAVEQKPSETQMFYSGAIRPIAVTTVASPADGEVSEMNFSYGQIVHKDQLLVKIKSDKLQNEFHDAVSSYLKNKEAFNNSKVSFEGTSQLFKEKIVSQQEFTQEKTSLENSEMAYLDSKFKLEQLISSVPGLDQKVKKIDLDDIANVRRVFDQKFDEVSLYAHSTGIVLYPVKKAEADGGDRELEVGGEVKKGQGLISIGDLSSLGVVFDASEMEINKLKPGQAVKVTTPAIPTMELNGKILSVAVQAKDTQAFSDNAKFPVKVTVDHIPEDIQKLLRVGMSVRVEVDLATTTVINVPLSAVVKQNGQTDVQIYNDKDKTKHWQKVETGLTSLNGINILSGLKSGDKIIATH